MKFDIVISNPPYQQSGVKAKRWTLWPKFIELAKDITKEYYCYVIPNSWLGPGKSHNLIMPDLIKASINASHYFDVGSTFSYIISKINTTGTAEIDNNIVKKTIPFIPSDLRYLSINNKFFNNITFNFIRTNEHHTTNIKDWLSLNGAYKIFHSHSQTYYSNKQPLRYSYEKYKAFYCMSGYTNCIIDKNVGFGQMIAWLELNNNEINGAKSVFNSKLYQKMLNINKWSGWNLLEIIKLLPKVDLTKQWTDNELYEYFNLTEQEIKLINETR